jgi:tetratricopeptide (TPR) repeat protein
MSNQPLLRSSITIACLLLVGIVFAASGLWEAAQANLLWLRVTGHLTYDRDDLDCGLSSYRAVEIGIPWSYSNDDCSANRARARLAFYAGDPDSTVHLLEMPNCWRSDPSAPYFVGSAYAQLGDHESARATWWDRGPYRCLYRLAKHLAQDADHASAIAIYIRVLEMDPGKTYVLRDLATSYAARADLTRAEQALKMALALRPNESSTLYEIADLSVQQKQYERAIDYYTRAIHGDMPQFRGFVALAFLALRESKIQEADEWCQQAAEMLSSPYGMLCKGRLAYAHRDYVAAVDLLRGAVQGLGQDKEAMFWLGLALLHTGNADQANYLFGQAEPALRPHHLCQLGEAYQELGDVRSALRAYERALAQNQTDQELIRIVQELRTQVGQAD